MKNEPYSLTIRLKPSPVLLALALAAHLAAGLALFFMDLPLAVMGASELTVAVSAAWAARVQAQKRGLALVLAADGALRLCRGGDDGSEVWAKVLPGAVLFPSVLWFALGWTGSDGRLRRLRLMLIAAEVEEGARDGEESGDRAQWRRLRVWLRHRALCSGSVMTKDEL
ncbi:MAG: hypothetical protein LBR95_08645 [Azoarcus sp.]|jgi:hypothetical protein|nr:hypothetical protein [Azoarcus sp.]